MARRQWEEGATRAGLGKLEAGPLVWQFSISLEHSNVRLLKLYATHAYTRMYISTCIHTLTCKSIQCAFELTFRLCESNYISMASGLDESCVGHFYAGQSLMFFFFFNTHRNLSPTFLSILTSQVDGRCGSWLLARARRCCDSSIALANFNLISVKRQRFAKIPQLVQLSHN